MTIMVNSAEQDFTNIGDTHCKQATTVREWQVADHALMLFG